MGKTFTRDNKKKDHRNHFRSQKRLKRLNDYMQDRKIVDDNDIDDAYTDYSEIG